MESTTATGGFRIELPEGSLDIHDLTVGQPAGDAPVVLAVHAITANGLSWQCVAEELYRRRGPGAVRFLAPDLRGRAASRATGGPYGLATHAQDVLAIADVFGTRPVLLGHSMGAYVCALAAARQPDRVSGAVLVDGGLAFPGPEDLDVGLDVDAAFEAVVGPAMAQLRMRFSSPRAYLDFWRDHPALGPALAGPQGPEVRRYLRHDLVESEDGSGAWVSSCRLDAVRADGADVRGDRETHEAVGKAVAAGVGVELVWAGRGLLDEARGLYDEQRLAALDLPSTMRVTAVPDANHYTLILDTQGVSAVVDALERRLAAPPRG